MRSLSVGCLLILQAGCNRANDKVGAQTVHTLVARGDVTEVEKLLRDHPDLLEVVNKESEGRRPLHTAVECGQIEMVVALLKQGAKVDARERLSDYQPLHLAAEGR